MKVTQLFSNLLTFFLLVTEEAKSQPECIPSQMDLWLPSSAELAPQDARLPLEETALQSKESQWGEGETKVVHFQWKNFKLGITLDNGEDIIKMKLCLREYQRR